MRLARWFSVLAGLLLLLSRSVPVAVSTTAYAQTSNPCDFSPLTNQTIQASAVWYGMCFPQRYSDATVIPYTSFRVVVDGVTRFRANLTQPFPPTASGWIYVQTPAIPLGVGTHSAVSYGSSANGEGSPSPTYVFQTTGVSLLLPGPGKILGVSR